MSMCDQDTDSRELHTLLLSKRQGQGRVGEVVRLSQEGFVGS